MNIVDIADLDCIYLSYDEPKKEETWVKIQNMVPWAQRVDGVKGSDAAHKAAPAWGKTSTTERAIILNKIADVMEATVRVWGEIKDIEAQFRTDYIPDIDVNFVWPMLRWARGQSLPKAVKDVDLQPGDFVRWTKQVIDILGQLAAADDGISRTARAAASSLDRGIVAW